MKAIGSIIAFVCWIIKRWLVHKDDPQVIYEAAKQAHAKMVLAHDGPAVNAELDRLLDTPEAKSGDHPGES